jgi:hypothetical protein
MVKIIEKHDHLKKFRMFPYRRVYKRNLINSYIYKHYKILDGPDRNVFEEEDEDIPDCLLGYLTDPRHYSEHIPGIVQFTHEMTLYDRSNGKFYYVDIDKESYTHRFLSQKINELYPEHSRYDDYTRLYSEEFFDQYPGLADWAESNGGVSQKLWIPEILIGGLV